MSEINQGLSPDVRLWDEQDEAVLRAVDSAPVIDDLDYTGLFDYDEHPAWCKCARVCGGDQ